MSVVAWRNKCLQMLKSVTEALQEGKAPPPQLVAFPPKGDVTEQEVVAHLSALPPLGAARKAKLLQLLPDLATTAFDYKGKPLFVGEGRVWAALAVNPPRRHIPGLLLLAEALAVTVAADPLEERLDTVVNYVLWQRFIVAAHSHVWMQGCPAWEALVGLDRMLYHTLPHEPVDMREATINTLLGVHTRGE